MKLLFLFFMPMQGLMFGAINKTIYLTREIGDSIVLIIDAENPGSFTGDLQKNSAIILKRKRKQ